MSLKRLVLTLSLFALPSAGLSLAQDAPPPERWIPDEALLSLELARPADLLGLLRDEEVTQLITSSTGWLAFRETDDYRELQGVVTYLEGALGLDWRTALERLTGGGITLAIGPNEDALVIVEALDAKLLDQLHDILLVIARGEAAKAGDDTRVRSTRRGELDIWSFNGKEAHAILGNRFLFANRAEVLDAALELVEGGQDGSLASSSSYQSARRTAGDETTALFWADLSRLKHQPGLARALDEGRENPMVALLFAGIAGALQEATWLATTLEIERDGVHLAARVDGTASEQADAATFAWPENPDTGPRPNLEVPGRIAAATFYRDLHRFYAGKDVLFPERTSSLIFFENMMGIFFSGRDLTDEVFASTRPDIRVVVAEQRYDEEIGTPEVQMPAFAAVVGLRDVEEFGEVLEEAWQKALGLVNFTRGQEALPGLIIDRDLHGDTKYTVAYFSSRGALDRTRLHERYNYRPTLALPGDYFVLSSTDALARDLIDALAAETSRAESPLSRVNTVLEIDGAQLSTILAANREGLVRNNMIEEGNSREAAETAIDVLLSIAELVGPVSFSLGADENHTTADLDVRLLRPGATRAR